MVIVSGLIVASKIREWLQILQRTRLSQIIDMYYSRRGIAYDPTYRACDRKSKIPDLFQNINLTEQVNFLFPGRY